MFRSAATVEYKAIQEHKLFGEIPRVEDNLNSNSTRLADQVELLKVQGYEKGYDQGYSDGIKLGESEGRKYGNIQAQQETAEARQLEIERFTRDCDSMLQEFEQMMIQWFEKTEIVVANMAMEVVKKIVAEELTTNPETALNIAKEVLQHVTHARNARIHVNPNDLALFDSHQEVLRKVSQNLRNIEFVSDPSIQSGIVVETEAGLIDSTVETRLTLIENEYFKAA